MDIDIKKALQLSAALIDGLELLSRMKTVAKKHSLNSFDCDMHCCKSKRL